MSCGMSIAGAQKLFSLVLSCSFLHNRVAMSTLKEQNCASVLSTGFRKAKVKIDSIFD